MLQSRAILARLWIAVAAVVGGVMIAERAGRGETLWLGIVGVIALTVRRPKAISLFGLVAGGIAAGILSAARFAPDTDIVQAAHSVPRCDIQGTVTDEAGGLGTLIRVETMRCGATEIRAGSVFVRRADLSLGSSVSGGGTLVPLGTDSFGRARARYGAAGELTNEDLETSPPTSPWWRAALTIRRSLTQVTDGLPSESGALLRGLTIGDVDDLSPDAIEMMRRAGLTHLVAVSGENVAIVLGVVSLAATALSHRIRVALCAAFLIFFVLVVGPEASVLRAAAMGGIGLVGLMLGRRTQPLYLLGLASLVLIVIRPLLVFSAGFLLSVAATLGIVLWADRIARRMPVPRPVAVPVSITAAAQLAVAPILIVLFRQVSVVGVLANVLAVPAVAPATVLGFVAATVGVVVPPLGRLAAAGAAPFAAWILLVADRLGSPAWASVALPSGAGVVIAVPLAVVAIRSVLAATGDNVAP